MKSSSTLEKPWIIQFPSSEPVQKKLRLVKPMDSALPKQREVLEKAESQTILQKNLLNEKENQTDFPIKLCYSFLDSVIRCPLRLLEATYNMADYPIFGPIYRTLSEATRHGIVGFIKDEENNKHNYSKRSLSALKTLSEKTIENVFGYLAIKPNIINSSVGRMLAGLGNMFIRLLPRMTSVTLNLRPAKEVQCKNLVDEFIGKSIGRALPRDIWGLLCEQIGINLLVDYKPVSKAYEELRTG